jgi:predicted aconitase with swiveling domain
MPEGRTLVPGEAHGPALVLTEPLSFWGGLDPATGAIMDVHHPQRGAVVIGMVLVMPGGRGSSSSSSVLAEAIRAATAPAAIVLAEPDPIIALGAIVARELYGPSIPIVVLEMKDLVTGNEVSVSAGDDVARLEVG